MSRPRRTVADAMTTEVAVRPPGDPAPTGGWTVVLSADGEVAGLVGPGGAGPAYVLDADVAIEDLLDSEELLEVLADGDTPALVVLRADRPVGVVTLDALAGEIMEATGAGQQLTTADFESHGERLRPAQDVRIQCGTCGRVNVFRRFSRVQAYRCQAGDHDFVPYWGA